MAQDNATIIRRFVDEVITEGKSTWQHSMSGKMLLNKFHCPDRVLDLKV